MDYSHELLLGKKYLTYICKLREMWKNDVSFGLVVAFFFMSNLPSIISSSKFDLLTPISDVPPSEDLFDYVQHPLKPSSLASSLLGEPIPTNKFFANFIVDAGDLKAWIHPYVIGVNRDSPYGLYISHSDEDMLGPQVDGRLKYYSNIQNQDIVFTSFEAVYGEFEQDFHLTNWDGIGTSANVDISLLNNSSSQSITFPLVRGMAYVTAIYKNVTPLVRTSHNITNFENMVVNEGAKFRISLQNGDIWILYVLVKDLAFAVNGNEVYANRQFSGVVRITKLPSQSQGIEQIFDNHYQTYPIGCSFSAEASADGKTAFYKFSWEVEGDSCGRLLHYAYPHHRGVISDAKETVVKIESTTKGTMVAFIGNAWTCKETLISPVSFLADQEPDSEKVPYIEDALVDDIQQDFLWVLSQPSNYFAGKSILKYAQLCLLADYFKWENETTQCIDKLEEIFEAVQTNTHGNPLVYDTTYRGVIGANGLKDIWVDFGSSYYNDHHYHYGYFVASAACLRHLRPDSAPQLDEIINAMIRDVSNPSADDRFFPMFRTLDWFSGHSWSQGLFASNEGKDVESISEDINFYWGLSLWGQVNGNKEVELLGRLVLSVLKRSAYEYFFMTLDNDNHPGNFEENHVTGIYFENKVHYTTWFGDNIEYIHGIQMIPPIPVLKEFRLPRFVSQEWKLLESTAESLMSGWQSILYLSYAIINKNEAFITLYNAELDDGLTRSWVLYWASTRDETDQTTEFLPPLALPNS
eukprot:CAMPEP_0117756340 /NCGR_PEP_ID=MMETSP0947-20121206/14014_1 /TAXON_ID=44440 /ORGANISM="Chattonella subsalsa, Strain CCMP2191" /LENGTH=750 /DNA_ID=CAMNT_0005575897 /DNA_START=58 /DNA_END=2310 /DNA_ORIENTATION=+